MGDRLGRPSGAVSFFISSPGGGCGGVAVKGPAGGESTKATNVVLFVCVCIYIYIYIYMHAYVCVSVVARLNTREATWFSV